MERRNGARTFLGAHLSPDRQSLIDALHTLDVHNLELSHENSYLVEEMIDLLESHADKRDKFNKKIDKLRKKLKACKDQTKGLQDQREGVLSLLKSCDALVQELLQMQNFQMKELRNIAAVSQDQPGGKRAKDNTQTDVALQQIQNDFINKMNQLQKMIIEKNDMINNLTGETKARMERLHRLSAQVKIQQADLDQSIKKCNTLQQEFKKEQAKREESWEMRKNEMQRQWLERENVQEMRVSKAEEELQQVIIQNIKLQKRVLEEQKKGFWGKKRRNTEEGEAAEYPAQLGHEEEEEKEEEEEPEEEEKKRKKVKKWRFWRRKDQGEKSQQVEGAAAGPDQPGQEERQAEEKPKKQGLWKRGHKKEETRAERPSKEEEAAAETGEQ